MTNADELPESTRSVPFVALSNTWSLSNARYSFGALIEVPDTGRHVSFPTLKQRIAINKFII